MIVFVVCFESWNFGKVFVVTFYIACAAGTWWRCNTLGIKEKAGSSSGGADKYYQDLKISCRYKNITQTRLVCSIL